MVTQSEADAALQARADAARVLSEAQEAYDNACERVTYLLTRMKLDDMRKV